MQDMTFGVKLPRYEIGSGAYARVAEELSPFGRRILLIGGNKALSAAQGALEAAIQGSALEIAAAVPFGGECTLRRAEELAQLAKEMNVQIVAGMGGGKAIDTAKACGFLAHLPVATFPTIASTCAAVSKLSILYREDGAFDHFLFLSEPPVFAFLHTGVIAAAPAKYLRAGMGDAIAKHFESTFSARGESVCYLDSLGLAISKTCYEPLLACGRRALSDCEAGRDGEALNNAVQSNIISTGMVSLLVREEYNGAIAHSLFYAMENLSAIRTCLHGDVVAWGVLVQLMLDGDGEKFREVYGFLSSLGVPVSLRAMGMLPSDADVLEALREVVHQPDMAHLPYPVTVEMVLEAVKRVETCAETPVRR